MASTASPTSKAASFVVSNPLSQSEVGWLKQQSKHVAAASQLFVERRAQGDYAVRRGGAERASAASPTQAEAIARAKELNPNQAPLVERVRNTDAGRRDKWRKA